MYRLGHQPAASCRACASSRAGIGRRRGGGRQGLERGSGAGWRRSRGAVRDVVGAATGGQADQIVANSDANIVRINDELCLTPEQEKNCGIA